jgi:hypothetical protein
MAGGHKRVLLAPALYRKPKVLFLNEGTANLEERLGGDRRADRKAADHTYRRRPPPGADPPRIGGLRPRRPQDQPARGRDEAGEGGRQVSRKVAQKYWMEQ